MGYINTAIDIPTLPFLNEPLQSLRIKNKMSQPSLEGWDIVVSLQGFKPRVF